MQQVEGTMENTERRLPPHSPVLRGSGFSPLTSVFLILTSIKK